MPIPLSRDSRASVLIQFSEQTGLQLGTQLNVSRSQTHELGPFVAQATADEAMTALLKDTDLSYTWQSRSSIRVFATIVQPPRPEAGRQELFFKDMSITSDASFWDRSSRKYAKAAIADRDGYQRTLDRTRSLLNAGDRVLELGCGTGTTALRLSADVKSYLATDFSAGMIAIAEEKRIAANATTLVFREATAEAIECEGARFNAVLGFNYLHLVRDLPGTLRCIHTLLAADGLFISKTPCLGDMNPLIRVVLLPAMRAIGMAPYAGVFSTTDLGRYLSLAGFELLSTEDHSTKSYDKRPYIVARKK